MKNQRTPTDEQAEKLRFTNKQMAAIKAVSRAMKRCDKLGVSLWDNYGTLTAYNRLTITGPDVFNDGEFDYNSSEYYEYIEDVYSNNFHAANADDPLTFDIIVKAKKITLYTED